MAGSVNKVILIGNLGADPEIRRTQDGRPIANLRVATSETWRDKTTGERREKTEWHRVVIFNEGLCRIAEQYLKKGSKVYLEGSLQTRKWQDKDGHDRYSTEVVLQGFNSQLTMLDTRGGGAAEPSDSDFGYVKVRPSPLVNLSSQKMGIHEWSYDNDVSLDLRFKVPHAPKELTLKDVNMEVELGFNKELGFKEAQRCLNCDIETVFSEPLCIECDACVDICPVDCITFTPNDPEPKLRLELTAPATNTTQDLYVSDYLKTGRIMVKDEDVCLHCGLCAERCPTGAWDMKKFYLEPAKAGACSR